VLALAAAALYAAYTFPAGLAALVSAAGWCWVRDRRNAWAQALGGLLLPAALGFGLASILMLAVNLWQPDPHATGAVQGIRALEDAVVVLRIWAVGISSFGLPKVAAFLVLLVIIGLLLALGRARPRSRPLTSFAAGQQVLSNAVVLLTAASTFTLFSAQALAGQARRDHETSRERYHAALRQDWDAEGRYLAAETIDVTVSRLTEIQRRQLAIVVTAIDRATARPARVARAIIARRVAGDYLVEASAEPGVREFLSHVLPAGAEGRASLPGEEIVGRQPATVDEWRRQRTVIRQQVEQAETHRRAADERRTAVQMAVAAAIGFVLPASSDTLSAFLDPVEDAMTDPLAASILGLTPGAFRGLSSQVEALWRQRRAPVPLSELRSLARDSATRQGEAAARLILPGGPLAPPVTKADADRRLRILGDEVDRRVRAISEDADRQAPRRTDDGRSSPLPALIENEHPADRVEGR